MMILRRWTLKVYPTSAEWGYLAYLFDGDERFLTRRGAHRAAAFYTRRLGLPLIMVPERIDR